MPERFPLPKQQTEGGNCADLPPQIVEKYFRAPPNEPLLRKVAIAICERCVILDDCRSHAIATASVYGFGIVGGVSNKQIVDARAWQRYELGLRDTPPTSRRPEFLGRSDAAERIEAVRTELEEGGER